MYHAAWGTQPLRGWLTVRKGLGEESVAAMRRSAARVSPSRRLPRSIVARRAARPDFDMRNMRVDDAGLQPSLFVRGHLTALRSSTPTASARLSASPAAIDALRRGTMTHASAGELLLDFEYFVRRRTHMESPWSRLISEPSWPVESVASR
jgi:hypothetical protein